MEKRRKKIKKVLNETVFASLFSLFLCKVHQDFSSKMGFFNWKCQDAEIKTLHRNKPGKFSYSVANFHQNHRQTYGGRGGSSFSSLFCLRKRQVLPQGHSWLSWCARRLSQSCENPLRSPELLLTWMLLCLVPKDAPEKTYSIAPFYFKGQFLTRSSVFLLKHNFIPPV